MDPAVEQQAIARVHRIGQVRPVVAHRLLIDGSIEVRHDAWLQAAQLDSRKRYQVTCEKFALLKFKLCVHCNDASAYGQAGQQLAVNHLDVFTGAKGDAELCVGGEADLPAALARTRVV